MKYAQGARRVGGRCRQSFLSVKWFVLVFWDGKWVTKTQEPGPKRPKNPG